MKQVLVALIFAITLPTFAEQARYHHVHLRATDTAEAANWYADHFDGKASHLGIYDVTRFSNVVFIFFPEDAAGVDGSEFPGELKGTSGTGLDHIGFNAVDTKAKMAELEKAGVEVTRPATVFPGKFTFGFVKDPWGTLIEITDTVKNNEFNHVHVVSDDPEKTVNWYADVFGGEVGHPANIPFIYAIPYGSVSLIATAKSVTGAPTGPSSRTMHRSVDHLGWSFSDLPKEMERLKKAGVNIILDTFDFRGTNIAFIESPEGVLIELVEIPAPKAEANADIDPVLLAALQKIAPNAVVIPGDAGDGFMEIMNPQEMSAWMCIRAVTEKDFEALSVKPPYTKSGIGFASMDIAAFRRSPGLEKDGQVRTEDFGPYHFINVIGFPKPGKNGGPMMATVDKHQIVGFKAGRQVALMETPDGVFVELIGSPENDSELTLPDGAEFITYIPEQPWIVQLPHPVKAYFGRGGAMRSFQGPIVLP